MSDTVTKAIQRLNRVLPLTRNQARLEAAVKQLHLDILRAYVEMGRSLTRREIEARVPDPDAAIRLLAQYDMVVFDDAGEPVGAYPFTMEQREYRLSVNGHQVHCMCALDALAVSPMFGIEVQIASRCAVTGDTISVRQRGLEILNLSEVAGLHVGINWNAASPAGSCAATLCTEMLFLRDESVARDWLNVDAENRQVFNLRDSVRFAAGFFTPLLA